MGFWDLTDFWGGVDMGFWAHVPKVASVGWKQFSIFLMDREAFEQRGFLDREAF